MQATLIRKQYLVSKHQANKVSLLAKASGSSATEIVRKAIDAYNPNNNDILDDLEEEELFNLAMSSVNKALKNVKSIRKNIKQTLTKLDNIEGKTNG